jgi:hypothetical protein
MHDELMESPLPASHPPRWRRLLGCTVVLALIAGVVLLCAGGILLTRTWPPVGLHSSASPYRILVAPENLLSAWSSDPPITRMNVTGQILVSGAVRTMLWTPHARADEASAVVDLNTLLGATDSQTTRVRASALSAYGQVAGVVEESVSGETWRDSVFLWTPEQPHGAVGELTLLTPPPPKNTSYRWYGEVRGLNDAGQVALDWGNTGMLWTPDNVNGTYGTWLNIRPDDVGNHVRLRGLNAYGQLAGFSSERAFLWTPESLLATHGTITWLDGGLERIVGITDFGQVVGTNADEDAALLWTPTHIHATIGRLTQITKPGNSAAIRFFAVSARGALAGVAIDVFRLSGVVNDAVVWLPDTPNSSTGRLQTLGALGWNEDGTAYDVNAAGTVLGDSCFLIRQGSDYPCQQLRYFVWDQRHGIADMQTLLDPASGYIIESVKAMNDAGQIVVLGKSSTDTYRLLLLTPRSEGAG